MHCVGIILCGWWCSLGYWPVPMCVHSFGITAQVNTLHWGLQGPFFKNWKQADISLCLSVSVSLPLFLCVSPCFNQFCSPICPFFELLSSPRITLSAQFLSVSVFYTDCVFMFLSLSRSSLHLHHLLSVSSIVSAQHYLKLQELVNILRTAKSLANHISFLLFPLCSTLYLHLLYSWIDSFI